MQEIITGLAEELIADGIAGQGVVAVAAHEGVVVGAADDGIVSVAAEEEKAANAGGFVKGDDEVISLTAVNGAGVHGKLNEIIAITCGDERSVVVFGAIEIAKNLTSSP